MIDDRSVSHVLILRSVPGSTYIVDPYQCVRIVILTVHILITAAEI